MTSKFLEFSKSRGTRIPVRRGGNPIADIAIWPWVSRYEWQTGDLGAYANVKRWYTAIAKRPAVQRGYKVPKDVGEIPMP